MTATQADIRLFTEVTPDLLGASAYEFLTNLGGPALIRLRGKDPSRRRVIVTLLHANEPSGLKAIHTMLLLGTAPATNLDIIVASVDAALTKPAFSHRYLNHEQDLNRCFAPPYTSPQDKLAQNILALIHTPGTEAVIDTHNTSSTSAAFCVATRLTQRTAALAAMFSETLVLLDKPLGTLMEMIDPDIPVVTVEFGGFLDPAADKLALQTLQRFASTDTHLDDASGAISVLNKPLRLTSKTSVAYSSGVETGSVLTMINSVADLNFQHVQPGQTLGWYNERQPELVAIGSTGENEFSRFFRLNAGRLETNADMTIFMATTDPQVASTDCILYFATDIQQHQFAKAPGTAV